MSEFIPEAFYARSDIVITGSHPENADFDNPDGWEFGLQEYVMVCNQQGDTYQLPVPKNAELLATRLMARWNNLRKLPVNFANWQIGRPVYGSEAYAQYGQDDDIQWERFA